jgi:sodium-dependent dicarboxylate transporter 2/3/5
MAEDRATLNFGRYYWRILLPFILLISFTIIPLPVEQEIQYTLAIFLCVAALWTLEPIPLIATALLIPVLLVVYGIFKPGEALVPYADPIIFLLLGGLILAESMHVCGLDRRLALYMTLRSDGRRFKVLAYTMLVAAFLAMWISNTATVALLIPVALRIAREGGEEGKLYLPLLMGIGVGAGAGGMATFIGTPTNAITFGLLENVDPLTLLEWMMVGVPAFLVTFICGLLVLYWLYPGKASVPLDAIKAEWAQLGPLSGKEKRTLTVFLVTVTLWIGGSLVVTYTDFSSGALSIAMVALLSAVVLFSVRSITWDEARQVQWDVLFVVGSGLAMGAALISSGTSEWLAEVMGQYLDGLPLLLIILVVGFISLVLTNFLSNTATVAVMVPLLITVSANLDASPYYLVLTATFVASISFATTIGTPPFTLIYGTGKVPRREMARSGILVSIPATIAVCLVVYGIVSLGIF